jgi:hypothetical protein
MSELKIHHNEEIKDLINQSRKFDVQGPGWFLWRLASIDSLKYFAVVADDGNIFYVHAPGCARMSQEGRVIIRVGDGEINKALKDTSLWSCPRFIEELFLPRHPSDLLGERSGLQVYGTFSYWVARSNSESMIEKFALTCSKQTLVTICHPNHFGGKWTIVASFPWIDRDAGYEKILSKFYEGDLSSYSSSLEFALCYSHENLVLEERNDFLRDQLGSAVMKKDINPTSWDLLLSGENIGTEDFPLKLKVNKKVLDLAKEVCEATTENPVDDYRKWKCRCNK